MSVLSELQRKVAEEGNELEWQSSGYECLMLRSPMQAWCGYVSVPAEHPWHGLAHNARVTPLPDRSIPGGIAPNVIGLFLEALRPESNDDTFPLDLCIAVHGGITFSAPRNQLRDQPAERTKWTFGFDCGHAGDLQPGLLSMVSNPSMFKGDSYRDRDYVFGETSRLAAQLRMVQERGHR